MSIDVDSKHGTSFIMANVRRSDGLLNSSGAGMVGRYRGDKHPVPPELIGIWFSTLNGDVLWQLAAAVKAGELNPFYALISTTKAQ